MRVSNAVRRATWRRAEGRCEYCLIREEDALTPLEPDHIVAVQHGGPTSLENLALACYDCNHCKGPNIASIDPETGQRVFLFNPRQDRWADHFRLAGPCIGPLTPIGRATAELLQLNSARRVRLRKELQRIGCYPA